ncbi:hypothetical protein EV421DRAFT_1147129 [Armillaria borealis]|uniref:Uncharacterized protein n=1 Tax=Armillaria borealis TaxID=47425 RepID=A0AA39J613_9AGAR|nr:hypothetical protein EV421DRAFT_1147129 [Armillaria borealis]
MKNENDGTRMAAEYYDPYNSQPSTPIESNPFHDKNGQERPKKSWFFHGLCFVLHAVLVCAHVLILLVWITRIEHKVVFPIGKRSNMLSTALVQVSQIISTVYIAGLVLVSQQLATRRNIHARQTLTATHDNMSAWSGLGAALISVWRQTAIAASVAGSVLVAGYFICVTILHITAPAIFSIQPFNTTQYAVISTTMGPPNISINNHGSSNPSSFWLDSTPVIPYLSHSDRISKIGLENGTLYDVLPTNTGEGGVFVNALTFNVTCGFVDGASITPIGTTGNWTVDTAYDDHVQPIPVLAPNTFKWLRYYSYNFQDPWRHSLFYTSANITDSQGSTGKLVDLNPPMRPGARMDTSRRNVSYFDEATVYTMQVIGCTVTLINQTAVVDAQSHLLQRVYPLGRKTSSTWSQWNPETIPANATVSSSPQGTTTIYARSEPTPYRIKRQSTNTTEPNPGSTGGPQPQNPDPEPPRPPPAPQDPDPEPAPPQSDPKPPPSPQKPDPEPAPPSSSDTSSSSQPGGNTSQQGSNNTPTSSIGNPNSGQQDSGQQNGGGQQNSGTSQQNTGQQGSTQPTSASTSSKAPSNNGITSSSSSNGQSPSSIPTSIITSTPSVSKVETGSTTQHSSTSTTSSAAQATSSGQFGSVTYYGMSDVFLDVWWEMFSQAAISRFPSTDDCPGFPWSNSQACNPLTVVEQFVMEDLGLHSILLDSPVRPVPKITLHDLENSLASATAASYWAALYAKAGGLKDDDPYNIENVNNYRVESMTGNATISYPFTATRLNINLTPLILGLLASIGLLLLVFWLVGKPIEGDSGIDTIGVLQIVWLMRTRPDLQRIVSDVDEPTVENLRESGMVYTSMHGHGSAETHPLTNG